MAERSKKVGPRPRGKSTEDIENELNLNSDSGDDNLINPSESESDSSIDGNDSQDNSLIEEELTLAQLEADQIPVIVERVYQEAPDEFEGPGPVPPEFLAAVEDPGEEADDENVEEEVEQEVAHDQVQGEEEVHDDGDVGQNMHLVGGQGLFRRVLAVPRGVRVRGGRAWRGRGGATFRGGIGRGERGRGNRGRGDAPRPRRGRGGPRGRPRGRGRGGRGRGQDLPAGDGGVPDGNPVGDGGVPAGNPAGDGGAPGDADLDPGPVGGDYHWGEPGRVPEIPAFTGVPGPRGEALEPETVGDTFDLFFSDELVAIIVEETNRCV